MARPQPSLRFADGGSFITRWAEGVMRPNATAKRLREIEAPPVPAPAPQPPPPPPPPPNPRVTKDNPAGIRFQDGGGMSKEAVMAAIARQRGERAPGPQPQAAAQPAQPQERGGIAALAADFLRNPGSVLQDRERKAGLRFQDGGHVPGSGRGDKIPAKYEPGEFVVSNDMIDDNPGLREGLANMRAQTLAARGKTVEEADAGAMTGKGLRAADGFDPLDRMARGLTGQNSLPPRSPLGSMADDLSRNTRAAPVPQPAGPGNPNVPPGGSAEARAFQAGRAAPPAAPAPAPATAPSAAAPEAPSRMARASGTLRTGGAVLGGAAMHAGAGALGALAAHVGSDIGAAPTGPGVLAGQRQSGDSGLSDQIPTDGYPQAPAAQRYNAWTDTDLGRNIGNTANALAPLGALGAGARAMGGAGRIAGLADTTVAGLAGGIQSVGAQPSIASAQDPYAQANADKIAQAGAAGGPPPPVASLRSDIARDGNSYSGGNISGDVTINGRAPGGGAISAQNMAAADNLAARETLRGQAGMGGGQQPQRPQMRQTLHSGNDWASRNALRNLEVGASSIQSSQSYWGNKEKGKADATNFQNAAAMDQLKRAGADPGSIARTNAGAGMYGDDQRLAGTQYASDNSLRGDFARAGADRRGAQLKQQQQMMMGEIFRQAGGDPVAAERLAASYGLDPQQFTGMASAAQTRGAANDKSARGVFSGMFGKDGEQMEAQAHHQAKQIFPDWDRMSPEDQAKASTEVVQSTKMLQSMNAQRNAGWGKKLGFDAPSPEMNQMPNVAGGQVGRVGALEGWTTPGVSRHDTKITLPGGAERYVRAGDMTEQQLRILQNRGAKPAKE